MVTYLSTDKDVRALIDNAMSKLRQSNKLTENQLKGAHSALTACVSFAEVAYHYKMFAKRYGVES